MTVITGYLNIENLTIAMENKLAKLRYQMETVVSFFDDLKEEPAEGMQLHELLYRLKEVSMQTEIAYDYLQDIEKITADVNSCTLGSIDYINKSEIECKLKKLENIESLIGLGMLEQANIARTIGFYQHLPQG